jgi:hypothetical protein
MSQIFDSLRSERGQSIGLALVAIAATIFAATLLHTRKVRAENDRVFELRVYHCLPGKLPALEARFRDTTSKILARHNLNVLGFWVADGPSASQNTFVFMVAYSSMEERKQDWAAVDADPAFQDVIKAEQREKTVEKIDVTYLRPTDFSVMR